MEEWRDIQEYEGIYQISNLGRVRSLNRIDRLGRIVKSRIKTACDNGNGYLVVNLKYDGKQKMMTIHKLVAEAFILNKNTFKSMPDENRDKINLDDLQVNHKDEDKQNNCVSNLEWCTHKYNNNYGTMRERTAKKHINHPDTSKAIKCIETKIVYPSIAEAERQLHIHGSNIVACLHR